MTTKPTLLILAAGMGSRYGGLKQLDTVGPNGEAIIDFSIYDAIRAGFGKVVFLIRKDLEAAFKDRFGSLLEGRIDYKFAYQELDMLPAGYKTPENRVKPWGTGHAVWCARHQINEPFAVINADDFYGKEAYEVLAQAMQETTPNQHYMVAYKLKNTVSPYGSVSRGVCTTNDADELKVVVEHTKIVKKPEGIFFDNHGTERLLNPELPVSMNFWGFQPGYFDWLERGLTHFLDEQGNELKSEYFIPTVVNQLINDGREKVKVLSSDAKWFGVTYKQDKKQVQEQILALIKTGAYPEKLWG